MPQPFAASPPPLSSQAARLDDVEIILDLSRLLSRIRHPTPTGVDRVEMAYARTLLRRVPDQLVFGAVHPSGVYGRLPRERALAFLDLTEQAWQAGAREAPRGLARALTLARTLADTRPRPVPPARGRRRVLVQSSPHHLHREAVVRAKLRREQARFICLLHDLIPIEYPEYARPGGDRTHIRRIETVARLADAVIANSAATAASFAPHLAASGRTIPVVPALLGLDSGPVEPRPGGEERPYFVCLGTIEPRKNHLLLLHVWRDLATRFGPNAIPKLIIVGRRGWENEQVVDLLERCPALVGCVEERARLPDEDVRRLLAGAAALLLPSFAEGYGMPVPEALALGVPVICSDLAALREAGGGAPDYIDPLDGPAWRAAILALADPDGEARRAHLARIRAWRAPTWDAHLTRVLDQVAVLAA